MNIITLNHWFVSGGLSEDDPHYGLPDKKRACIIGTKEGFNNEEGKIRTSYIVNSNGREIETFNGNRFHLGITNSYWLEWLRKQGYEYDKLNPIKIQK